RLLTLTDRRGRGGQDTLGDESSSRAARRLPGRRVAGRAGIAARNRSDPADGGCRVRRLRRGRGPLAPHAGYSRGGSAEIIIRMRQQTPSSSRARLPTTPPHLARPELAPQTTPPTTPLCRSVAKFRSSDSRIVAHWGRAKCAKLATTRNLAHHERCYAVHWAVHVVSEVTPSLRRARGRGSRNVMMRSADRAAFGRLLRQYRRAADLTQVALAERAGLS